MPSSLAQGSLTIGTGSRCELVGLLLRNADPKLAYAGLSWGYDALVGEPPETQGSAQDSGLFHIHSSIPAGLTCWKTKVTGELRFWVLLLLTKVDMPSDIRMRETSHSKPVCLMCNCLFLSIQDQGDFIQQLSHSRCGDKPYHYRTCRTRRRLTSGSAQDDPSFRWTFFVAPS